MENYVVQTIDGKLFYTGKAGDEYASPCLEDAFRMTWQLAQHKAELFTRLDIGGHFARWEAVEQAA